LSGKAVFVYDGSDAAGHAGETDYGAGAVADGDKMFDFVQELLNQVVPRKRSVTGYTLLEEDGVYGDNTRDAVERFRSSFSLDNKALNDGRNSFRRLQREYGLSDGDAGMIIDRETLVGVEQRATDDLVNGTGGSSGDTGLYELYDNVVRKFIDAMIARAVAYRDATFSDANRNWKPRTYPTDSAQTVGVSYCFGCKDTVEEFVSTVSDCQVANPVPSNYRGNLKNEGCVVGDGEADWPGLKENEYDLWYNDPDDANDPFGDERYHPRYWAGIDCSGFVQWCVEAGRQAADGMNITIPSPPRWRSSQKIFTENNSRNVYYLSYPSDSNDRKELMKKFKRGDLLRYSSHISIVYSERYGESDHNGDYDVIHAFSWECSANTQQCQTYPWLRKVGVTANNHPGLGAPRGFGRIRLWQ